MRNILSLTCHITFAAALTLGLASPSKAQTGMFDPATRSDSLYLVRAGDNAKAFFYDQLDQLSQAMEPNGYHLEFVDARDPRLYGPGEPWQPPTPADLVIVKVAANGAWRALAFVIDRPGYLRLKEVPTGNFIIDVAFDAERIAFSSRWEGVFASVVRNTWGAGWNYIYYLRGLGNAVSPAQFDQAVATFLSNAARYVVSR